MVVVLGGVGQLAGTVYAALGLGVLNKFLEGVAGAVLAKIMVLVFIVVFIQKRPQGLFAMKGRSAEMSAMRSTVRDGRSPRDGPVSLTRCGWAGAVLGALALRRRARPAAEPRRARTAAPCTLSDYAVALIGKIMCYAICALAMDLIWGYTGILSLGHGVFFALGGYAMGMYLMRQIGRDGSTTATCPTSWCSSTGRTSLALGVLGFLRRAALLVVLVPGAARVRVRLLRVPLAHQGRLLLDHHAGDDVRGDAAVLPQRHGLRRQQRLHRLQAHPRLSRIATPATRMVLFVLTGCVLIALLPDGPLHRDAASSAACCRRSATPRAA